MSTGENGLEKLEGKERQGRTADKLRHWETFLAEYRLPNWDDIPNLGLFMDQVVFYLKECLDYLPPELKCGEIITASAINNYVRTGVVPHPVRKRYYREHIVYLIIICSLKQSLSIANISKIVPCDLDPDRLRSIYEEYSQCHRLAAEYFTKQVRIIASPLLGRSSKAKGELMVDSAEELLVSSAIIGGFAQLLAEKLIER